MFAAVARVVTKRAWLVIGVWLALAVGLILASPGLGPITNSDQVAFLPSSAESVHASAVARQFAPPGVAADASSGAIVVRRTDGASLTDADIAIVAELAQRLQAAKPPAVASIAFIPQQMVAPDRDVAFVSVAFTGPAARDDVQAAVTGLRDATRTGLAGTGLRGESTGQAAIVVDNKSAFTSAELLVTIATVALIVILLLVIFRSPVAALLPLAAVGLVFGISTALIAVGGRWWHYKIGQELPTILTVVLFGIGTDYILFLLFRYRERLRAGDTPAEAIVTAVARIGEVIFSAAFAVIAGFGALGLAALGFFTTLGPSLAVGALVMLAAALTLVPAVVSLLGRRVFWPSSSATVTVERHPRFAALGRGVTRHPVAVVVAGIALLGGLSGGLAVFAADYNPIDQLPSSTEATRAFADMQHGFPAGVLAPTQLYLTGPQAIPSAEVSAFVARVARTPGVAAVLAPTIAADGRAVDVPVVIGANPYSAAGLDFVSGPLRSAARADAPSGTTVLVGGETMALADVRATTGDDLALIFPVAAALFLIILVLVLRSAASPVYLVVLVAGGFAAALGAVSLVFQTGFRAAGLQFALPIVLYLFVTAIGTDYNILMTARIREELRDGRTPREAAALAVEHAGPSVAAAAVILAGTFAALLVSGIPIFGQIGFGVVLGIALVSFVVSILLVPAASALLGRAAWWPGRVDVIAPSPDDRSAVEVVGTP